MVVWKALAFGFCVEAVGNGVAFHAVPWDFFQIRLWERGHFIAVGRGT